MRAPRYGLGTVCKRVAGLRPKQHTLITAEDRALAAVQGDSRWMLVSVALPRFWARGAPVKET